MARTHSSYSSPNEAKTAVKYLNEGAKVAAYNHLLPHFSQFIGDCCEKGDLILRKVSPKQEMNDCYQKLGYQLVGCKEKYTTYEAQTVTETEYYVSGYSGRVTSNGTLDVSEDIGSCNIKRGEVKETREKKSAILERWVKILPKGERETYLKKEERFLTVARPFLQIESLSPTQGKPSCLFALLHTLFMFLAFALPVLVSNFANLLFAASDLFRFFLLPHIIAAGCYALSLVLYFIFIAPFRDKRVVVDVRDSRYFMSLWLCPVFFIVDAVFPIVCQHTQGGWFYVLNAVNWLIDLCGIILLLISLFYLISLHHYRVISHNHRLRQCFTDKSHVEMVKSLLKSLADSSYTAFIPKAAQQAGLQLLDQFTKFSNFEKVVDPFCDDITGYADFNNDYLILSQTEESVAAALAQMKKEASDPCAAKKTTRRTTKKKAPVVDEAAIAAMQNILEKMNNTKPE